LSHKIATAMMVPNTLKRLESLPHGCTFLSRSPFLLRDAEKLGGF